VTAKDSPLLAKEDDLHTKEFDENVMYAIEIAKHAA
jgi:hypothetical protein